MTVLIASLQKLIGPDLAVILLIIVVLAGIPALIALPIVFILNRRNKKPPPLPKNIRDGEGELGDQ
jgi:hypothetical protein